MVLVDSGVVVIIVDIKLEEFKQQQKQLVVPLVTISGSGMKTIHHPLRVLELLQHNQTGQHTTVE